MSHKLDKIFLVYSSYPTSVHTCVYVSVSVLCVPCVDVFCVCVTEIKYDKFH